MRQPPAFAVPPRVGSTRGTPAEAGTSYAVVWWCCIVVCWLCAASLGCSFEESSKLERMQRHVLSCLSQKCNFYCILQHFYNVATLYLQNVFFEFQ